MANFNKLESKERPMKKKCSIISCLCCILLFWGNTAFGLEDIKVKYALYLQQIDNIKHSLENRSSGDALKAINEFKKDWESQDPEVREKTGYVMCEILYLEVDAFSKSGKKSAALDSLKGVISFEKEHNLLYSPLLADYTLYKNAVCSFVSSCQGEVWNYPQILEHFGSKNFAFSKSPPNHNFVAVLFRSNDFSQEDIEFSVVILYRRNAEGIYEASELKVPWTKDHTLSLENSGSDIPNIILRKQFRTGKTETVTIGIRDGLKIISRDRKKTHLSWDQSAAMNRNLSLNPRFPSSGLGTEPLRIFQTAVKPCNARRD
jgi:hypothetical protein